MREHIGASQTHQDGSDLERTPPTMNSRTLCFSACLLAMTSLVASAGDVPDTPALRVAKSLSEAGHAGRGRADRIITAEDGVPLRRSRFLAVQHAETVERPSSAPLLLAPPRDFMPGKTALEDLFGAASVTVTGAASAAPWGDVKAVDSVGMPDAASSALDFSREVRAARTRVDQADSQANQARGNLLPNLSVRYAAGREQSRPSSITDPATGAPKVSDNHPRTDSSVTLRQPLVDLATLADWQRRKTLVNSKQAALQGTQGDEYLLVVQSYLNLVSSRLLAGLARDYEKQLNELLDYISQRAAAGASSDSDMQRVKARALTARAARMEQEAAQEAALVEFSRLTNLVPTQLRLPRFADLNLTVPETIGKATDVGLARNPEIVALQAEFDAADWDKLSAKGRYAPRLDLELTDQKVHNAGGPVGLQHDTRAMVVFSWTVFAGGSDYHYNQERAARYEEVRWRLDDQKRRLIQGLTSQYASLDSSRARLASGYKELGAITEAARAMSERMLAGNTSLLDLLDVLERTYQTRTRLLALHLQEISSGAQIARYLGQTSATSGEAPTAVTARPGGAS